MSMELLTICQYVYHQYTPMAVLLTFETRYISRFKEAEAQEHARAPLDCDHAQGGALDCISNRKELCSICSICGAVVFLKYLNKKLFPFVRY